MEMVDILTDETEHGDAIDILVSYAALEPEFGEYIERGFVISIEKVKRHGMTSEVFKVRIVLEATLWQDITEDEVWTLHMVHGDRYEIFPGSDATTVSEVKPLLSAGLVGMVGGTRQDVEAKYDAYMDPVVAALSETTGRITRARYYEERCM